jgi:hypothetical protein
MVQKCLAPSRLETGHHRQLSAIFNRLQPAPVPRIKLKGSKRETIPAVCYAQCNNCYLEAQRVGKSPALCAPGSPFESDYASCQSCVAANGDLTKVSLQTYVVPEFEPFLSFCQAQPAIPEISSSAAGTTTSTKTVTPGTATESVVVATATASTPTLTVGVTTQALANANTSPVATSSPTAALNSQSTGVKTSIPSSTRSSSLMATNTGPNQVTASSSNSLRSFSFVLLALLLVVSVLSLFN